MVIRWGGVALVALSAQLLAILGPLGGDDLPRRALFLASYLLLIAFVAANLRRPGILVMGIGILLNFSVILANGGLMPVTPETLARAGYEVPPEVSAGDWVPDSKDVLLEREDVRLWFLGDRLVWSALPKFRAFSIGDAIIVAGLAVTLADLLLPRLVTEGAGGLPAPGQNRRQSS